MGNDQYPKRSATAFIAGLGAFQSFLLFLLSIVLSTQKNFGAFLSPVYCAIVNASSKLFSMRSMRMAVFSKIRVASLARNPSKSLFAMDTYFQSAVH